jgi:hypothetical protein
MYGVVTSIGCFTLGFSVKDLAKALDRIIREVAT